MLNGLKIFPELKVRTHKDFRYSIPSPYKDSKYDVKNFIDVTFGQISWITPVNTRLIIPNDFSTEYIVVKNGVRKTFFQPKIFSNTIYVFGGSTIFCAEVPDEYTVSSYLQKFVNDKFPNRYKVENFGASSVNSAQELERLRTINIQKGDIVVFYDGANDVLQSIYNDDPSGYIIGKNNNILKELNPLNKFIVYIHARYGQYSMFINYFLDPYKYNNTPLHLNNKAHIEQRENEMEKIFVSNVVLAQKYVIQREASFYHFLQPTIFSRNHLSVYENNLILNNHIIGTGIGASFKIAYPTLKKDVQNLNNDYGINTYDLTNIFDSREKGEEFFLDWVHVADKGNYYIAKSMYEKIYNHNGFEF